MGGRAEAQIFTLGRSKWVASMKRIIGIESKLETRVKANT
jgi:hypothetical protein